MNKEVKIGILIGVVIVVLLAALAGLDYYNQQSKLVKEKDPKLTQEDRAIYDDRLTKANNELGNEALSDEERYNLLMYKGYQLHGLGKLAEAKAVFEDAIDLDKENHLAYVAMYTVQLEMNDKEGARKNIQKAVELMPTNADIWKKYIIMEEERFGASAQTLNDLYLQALEKTGNHIDVMTSYAVHLESVGSLQAAKEYWQKAIEANAAGKALYEAEIKRLDALIAQQNQQ